MNLVVHFFRARSSLILSCSSGLFVLYYAACWSGEGRGKKIIVMERRDGGN